jgi:hypothetical protein
MSFSAPTTVASVSTTGYEATLNIGSPPAPVAELTTFKINAFTVPKVKQTTLLSPNNTEENMGGMIDPGTIDISGNFIGSASQLQISTLAKAGTTFTFTAVGAVNNRTAGYTYTQAGFFASYEVGPFENNKTIDFTAKIQLTGTFTETVA